MKVDRIYDSEDHVSLTGVQNGTRAVPPNTILIVVRGMILAKEFPVAMCKKTVTFNQDLKAVRVDPSLDNEFFYYWCKSSSYHILGTVDEAAHGTKRLQTDRFLEMDISIPPLPTQHRIASVLSTYDDLIENNTRRIKILEEMTRALYRAWFVEVDRSSWVEVKLGDICDYLSRGISPKYDDKSDFIVINQKCVRDHCVSLKEARRHKSHIPTDKIIRKYDVLINSTGVGTLGRVAQVLAPLSDCTVDSHVTIVRSSEKFDPHWFGMTLLSLERHFEDQGAGATGQTELARSRVFDTTICLAPTSIQNKFGLLVAPLRSATVALRDQSKNLRRTRDLLLPRLLSGEVDVSQVPLPAEAPEAEPEEAVTAERESTEPVKRGRGRPRKKG